MLFVNSRGQLLMILRDDDPDIPDPGMWDLPGGHLEGCETPHDCIRREMAEELPGVDIGAFREYVVVEFEDRIDHMFWTRVDVSEATLNRILREGQRVAWFGRDDLGRLRIASNFEQIISSFFGDLETRRLAEC
jgi:8-oxo-dGTP diphosphatase